jgi:hypothetical protein
MVIFPHVVPTHRSVAQYQRWTLLVIGSIIPSVASVTLAILRNTEDR